MQLKVSIVGNMMKLFWKRGDDHAIEDFKFKMEIDDDEDVVNEDFFKTIYKKKDEGPHHYFGLICNKMCMIRKGCMSWCTPISNWNQTFICLC